MCCESVGGVLVCTGLNLSGGLNQGTKSWKSLMAHSLSACRSHRHRSTAQHTAQHSTVLLRQRPSAAKEVSKMS